MAVPRDPDDVGGVKGGVSGAVVSRSMRLALKWSPSREKLKLFAVRFLAQARLNVTEHSLLIVLISNLAHY